MTMAGCRNTEPFQKDITKLAETFTVNYIQKQIPDHWNMLINKVGTENVCVMSIIK